MNLQLGLAQAHPEESLTLGSKWENGLLSVMLTNLLIIFRQGLFVLCFALQSICCEVLCGKTHLQTLKKEDDTNYASSIKRGVVVFRKEECLVNKLIAGI